MAILFILDFGMHFSVVGEHFRYVSNFIWHVVNIVKEEEWPEYWALWHTTLDVFPVGDSVSEDNPLTSAWQEGLYPLKYFASDSAFPELSDEALVRNSVKGFGEVQIDYVGLYPFIVISSPVIQAFQ